MISMVLCCYDVQGTYVIVSSKFFRVGCAVRLDMSLQSGSMEKAAEGGWQKASSRLLNSLLAFIISPVAILASHDGEMWQ